MKYGFKVQKGVSVFLCYFCGCCDSLSEPYFLCEHGRSIKHVRGLCPHTAVAIVVVSVSVMIVVKLIIVLFSG